MTKHKISPDVLNESNQGKVTNFIIDEGEDLNDWDPEHGKENDEVKEYKTNPFPVDAFPESLQQIIASTHEHLNFPVDFIGASLLYAASVAIGNTYRVEVKRGFQQSAVLYMAIIARAGTNKSHPLSWAVKPIEAVDARSYLKYQKEFQDYMALKNEPKKKVKEGEPLPPLPKKPSFKKYIVSDFTPEALADVHQNNKRGIGVHVDELAGWFKNFNRYNKGSEQEFWLSQWSGKPINIDRKTSEPVYIITPFISVAGTIQNGILKDLAKEGRNQNGFIDRILPVIPDNVKKEYWSESELPQDIYERWEGIISRVMNIEQSWDSNYNPSPKILCFTHEAKKLLLEWQKQNTDSCNEADNEDLSGVFSKMDIYISRLALILEILRFACDEKQQGAISADTLQRAIKLIEYFKNCAMKVNTILSSNSPLNNYPEDKRALYDALPTEFTTGEGLRIATDHGFAERTFKAFIKDQELFRWLSRGEYQKRL